MATSALTAFGATGWMFVTLNCSGKFPLREALRRSWSATWPSSPLMPFSTRPNFFSYDTPGSVTWLHRLASCSGLGSGGAPGGGGGGGSSGALSTTARTWKTAVPPEAPDVTPAAAAPMVATAATPVANNFTVIVVPSIWT
jgi:hypothetical protein